MENYLRIATISPKVSVGNVIQNNENIKKILTSLNEEQVDIVVTPRLALTSIGIEDIFFEEKLLKDVDNALFELTEYSKNFDMLICVTNPYKYQNNLYEVATLINKGKILGMVPRDSYDNIFTKANDIDVIIKKFNNIENKYIYFPFNKNLIFVDNNNENVTISINFGMDKNQFTSNIILNPHCIEETFDVDKYYNIYQQKSLDEYKVYAVASPNYTESSSKSVYFQRCMIYEEGELINKCNKITDEYVIGDIDIDKFSIVKKHKSTNFSHDINKLIYFETGPNKSFTSLYRKFDQTPYIDKNFDPYNFSMHIINIQALALLKRFNVIKAKTFVLGFSGGLDSTLALLVVKKAMEISSLSDEALKVLTMPCFGTSKLSMGNSYNLCMSLGIKPINVDITDDVILHLEKINHSIDNRNTTYENAQARERTQVLMDVANDCNGIVVGTSDLSEIALGFSTYNGDHMSMYNVNCGITKTLIRYILQSITNYNLKNNGNVLLANTLQIILNKPVSPELINDDNTKITQNTEEILGPYKLIDFYLYYYLKYHYDKEKLLELATRTFVNSEKDSFDIDIISKTLDTFFNRFYKAQYKRNTSPDGPSIGIPDLNSKYSFVAPSDLEI